MFNRAYQIIDRAIRSNWQAGLTVRIVKNPAGWSRIGPMARDWYTNYDCRSMIEQTLQNIADAQHANGSFAPTTAPEYIYSRASGLIRLPNHLTWVVW